MAAIDVKFMKGNRALAKQTGSKYTEKKANTKKTGRKTGKK